MVPFVYPFWLHDDDDEKIEPAHWISDGRSDRQKEFDRKHANWMLYFVIAIFGIFALMVIWYGF